MIAVKAIYDRGKVQFLEPLPEIERAVVAVIFLGSPPLETLLADYQDAFRATEWGAPMDEAGAATLLALHEELASYRAEAESALETREKPSA
jgi:hypothetical protein